MNHLSFQRLPKLLGSSLQSKVKREYWGRAFLSNCLCCFLLCLHFFVPLAANGEPFAIMCKEAGGFRPLHFHCLADVGYSAPICPIDCLSPPPFSIPMGCFQSFCICVSQAHLSRSCCSAVYSNYPLVKGNLTLAWPLLMEPGLAAGD